jgi:alpha-N-arabinofuranosidase
MGWTLGLAALAACLSLATTATGAAGSNVVSVTIDASVTSAPVTQYEYGMFIEPIGTLIARTLWAEMLDDRKSTTPL